MIVQYPDNILITKAKRVYKREFAEIAKLLNEAFKEIPCAGIAAPQIGLSKRAFIAQGEVYFNPVITARFGGQCNYREGCLSIAQRGLEVHRFNGIHMIWSNERGAQFGSKFTGYSAQILQHEYDHIEGTLLIHYRQTEMPLHTDLKYRSVHP